MQEKFMQVKITKAKFLRAVFTLWRVSKRLFEKLLNLI